MSNKRELIEEQYSEIMFCDGYDDCIVGIVDKFGSEPIVCYDKNKIIDKMIEDGMTTDDAYEYFDFNVIGAYVGERTPCFLDNIE